MSQFWPQSPAHHSKCKEDNKESNKKELTKIMVKNKIN